MKHTYESKDEWYDHLVVVATNHANRTAVRDKEGWVDNWRNQTPEEAYYDEFPEHSPANK